MSKSLLHGDHRVARMHVHSCTYNLILSGDSTPLFSSTMSDQKAYIVTLKETSTDADVSTVKLKISEFGGKIVDEFTLIKGFVAKLPAIHSLAIADHEHVLSIEEDREVHIQS